MSKNTVREKVLAKAVAQTGLTTLIEVKTANYDRLVAQIKVATHDLDAFVISAKASPYADYKTLRSASGSYTSPTGILLDCTGDLTAQVAATSNTFVLDVGGFYQVKLEASSAHAAGSAVDVYTGLR